MFQYIKGNLEFIGQDYVVVDNHDIGYKIYTSNSSIVKLRTKIDKVTVFTQIIHRDEDINIFGFSTMEELKMFQLLTTVTGVGAKVALGILSSIPIERLIGMIISDDIQGITKAQGVGKKTAQRIILELKDKVDRQLAKVEPSFLNVMDSASGDFEEAVEALVMLGYGKIQAMEAVNSVKDSCVNIEEVIKKALRFLGK